MIIMYVVTRATAILAIATTIVSFVIVPILALAAPIPSENAISAGYVHPFVVYGGIAAASLTTIALVCALTEHAIAKRQGDIDGVSLG